MIILYDENEREFTSLGIGVLSDASSCVVSEELNGPFELEMEYPVNGSHYKDLKHKRLIFAKPNDVMQPQPFRIYKITRPINGVVTVYAEHISYDTSKVPIKAFSVQSLEELCYESPESPGAIYQNRMVDTPFKLKRGSDKGTGNDISFLTKVPYSFRQLLAGSQDSILDTYTGEYTFDMFDITLSNRRGKDRNFTIRYAKNMTDLEQETSTELMYDGICCYYNSTTTETKQTLTKTYKAAYISKDASSTEPIVDKDNIRVYPPEYISYNDGGSGIGSILTTAVTNIIATENTDDIKMYNHLIHARNITLPGMSDEKPYIYDVTYQMAYINKDCQAEFGSTWLLSEEGDTSKVINPQPWDKDTMNPYKPDAPIYRIYTTNAFLYKVYIWDSNLQKYREITNDDGIEEYAPTLPNVGTESEEKDNIILYEGSIIYVGEKRAVPNENGTEYGSDWLYEIEEELIQVTASDPRWKLSANPLTPQNGINYKVATLETFIQAYYKQGDLNSNKIPNNFYSNSECTELLVPVDQQGYFIISLEPGDAYGKEFKFRYSAYDKEYSYVSDTRYVYTNYIWNGTEYIERDTSNDKILTLDLTDKFNEQPKNNQKFHKTIYDETIKYIKENKIGELKETIKVSFIKLSTSPEYSKWKELEKVELGDTVHVAYEDLEINVRKKVIKTNYNVLKETYDEIELGEKSSNFTNNAVISGDGVSSLTNDRNFTDDITVTNLFAKYIEADYIKAFQASFDEAQIKTLTSDSITATLIEAERFEIDKLVAGLLVADNAAIKDTLTAGNVVINGGGQLDIRNGSISIKGDERIADAVRAYINDEYTVEYGYDWLKANKSDTEYMVPDTSKIYIVYQVVGDEDIEVGYYRYEPSPTERYLKKDLNPEVFFSVDEGGNVTANSLEITGGNIQLGPIYVDDPDHPGQQTVSGYNFIVNNDGEVIAKKIYITDGTIDTDSGNLRGIDSLEVSTINTEDIITENAKIQYLNITSASFIPEEFIIAYIIPNSREYTSKWLSNTEGGTTPLTPEVGKYYKVTNSGITSYYKWSGMNYVDTSEGSISLGSILIQEETEYTTSSSYRTIKSKTEINNDTVYVIVYLDPAYPEDITDVGITITFGYLRVTFEDGSFSTQPIINHYGVIKAGIGEYRIPYTIVKEGTTISNAEVSMYISGSSQRWVSRKIIDENNTTININAANLTGISKIGKRDDPIESVYSDNIYIDRLFMNKGSKTYKCPIIIAGEYTATRFNYTNATEHKDWMFINYALLGIKQEDVSDIISVMAINIPTSTETKWDDNPNLIVEVTSEFVPISPGSSVGSTYYGIFIYNHWNYDHNKFYLIVCIDPD